MIPMETPRRAPYRHQDAGTRNERQDLVSWLQAQRNIGEEYNQLFRPEFRRNYGMWRGMAGRYIHVDNASKWRSTVVPPEAFRMVMTHLPRTVQDFFPMHAWYGCWSYNENYNYELLVKSTLAAQFHRSEVVKTSIPFMQSAAVLGHAIGKVVWDVDISDRVRDDLEPIMDVVAGEPVTMQIPVQRTTPEIVFAGPRFSGVNLFRFTQDPTGQMLWGAEEIPTTLEALKEVNRRIPGTYIDLRTIEAKTAWTEKGQGGPQGVGRTDRMGAMGPHDIVAELEGISAYDRPHVGGNPLSMWQFWGWVPPHVLDYGEENTQWRLICVVNNTDIVRDVPAPTHDHRPPFFNCQYIPMFGRLYGLSYISVVAGLIDEMTQLKRQRMDSILQNMNPLTIINGGVRWSNKQFNRELGAVVEIQNAGTEFNINNAITRFDTQPLLNDTWAAEAELRRMMDEAAGVTDLFQGQATTKRQTLGEMEILRDEGNMTHNLIAQWANISHKAELVRRYWGLSQRFMTDDQMVRVLGKQSSQAVLVNREEIQDGVEFFLEGGFFGNTGLRRAAVLERGLTLSQQEPFARYYKPGIYLREYLSALGEPNPDRVIWSDEQLAQQEQQRFMDQLAVLQMGAEAQLAGGAGGAQPGGAGQAGAGPSQNGGNAGVAVPGGNAGGAQRGPAF